MFERTHIFLRSYPDFTLFPVRTEHFKKSLFPSSTMLWNDIDTSVHALDSVILFKKALFRIFDVPQQNMLFNFSLDRYSSIIHTRLRLNVCALNYYLFKIGCKPSPECLCGFEVESINHYFLHCPVFAAPRLKLLSSAACIFAHRWHAMTEIQLISVFLSGS